MKYNLYTAYCLFIQSVFASSNLPEIKLDFKKAREQNFQNTLMANFHILIDFNLSKRELGKILAVWFILVPDMQTWTDPSDYLLSLIINYLGLSVTVISQNYKNRWCSVYRNMSYIQTLLCCRFVWFHRWFSRN